MRRLEPAATMMAAQVPCTTCCSECCMMLVLFLPPGRLRWWERAGCPVLRMRENHAACDRLQYTGDSDFDSATHVLATTFNYDHRAIVQVADALTQFFAFLHNLDIDILAGKQNGLDCVRQFVDVQHFDALQFRHAVEVEVVSDDGAMQVTRHLHQLAIYLGNAFYVVISNLDRNGGVFLQAVQHFQSAPTAIAAHRIGRVGDMLQLIEDKAGDDKRTGDEAGRADISDTPVDNRAGIQQNLRDRFGMVGSGLFTLFAALAFFLALAFAIAPILKNGLEEVDDIIFTLHAQGNPEEAEDHRANQGQNVSESGGQIRQGDKEQHGDDKSDDCCYQVAGGSIAHPAIRNNSDVWCDEKSKDNSYNCNPDEPP